MSADLSVFETLEPVTVFQNEEKYAAFYDRIKDEVAKFQPDTSTVTGRKAIASLARRVTRTKTALDQAGKALNEQARNQINLVDATRRKMRQELEMLSASARQPLTQWEQNEDFRIEAVNKFFEEVAEMAEILPSDTSETVSNRLREMAAFIVSKDIFRERTTESVDVRISAMKILSAAVERLKVQEENDRELARLRAEEERRLGEQRAREDQAARENAEKERLEKEVSDRKVAEAAAAQRARDDERRKAEAEIAAAKQEKEALIAAQKQAERKRQDAVQREDDERRKREADKAHRALIIAEVQLAMVNAGASKLSAKKIVKALERSKIPHVTLEF
jgi:colicin import membrane protein